MPFEGEFRLQEELAELVAGRMLAEAPERAGMRVVRAHFADRDLNFIKLLAQKIVRQSNAVALLACDRPQPSLVFAQSAGGRLDMGAWMKEAMASLGGRGGGTRDMAQGGAPPGANISAALEGALAKIGGS